MNRLVGPLMALGGLVVVAAGSSAVASSAGSTLAHLSQRPTLLSFRMTSASTGWALTSKRVLHTTDGGRSWLDRTPPGLTRTSSQTGPAGGAPINIATSGRNAFWIAVPSPGRVTVFRTLDAGARWRSAAVNPSALTRLPVSDVPVVLSLAVVNARDGWLLISNGGGGAGSEDVELYRTIDAGTSWRPLAVSTQAHPSPDGLPAGGIKTGLGFASVRRGWLTGYRGSQSGFWLYATRDGGRTWRATTLPTPPGYPATGQFPLTFQPDFTGASGVLPVLWPAEGATVSYATRDGGVHWRPTAPVPCPGGNALRAWSWPDATHGFAATSTKLCETSNGGRSWRCRGQPTILRGLTELQFVSGRLGWALAGGHLLATTISGTTWTLLP